MRTLATALLFACSPSAPRNPVTNHEITGTVVAIYWEAPGAKGRFRAALYRDSTRFAAPSKKDLFDEVTGHVKAAYPKDASLIWVLATNWPWSSRDE